MLIYRVSQLSLAKGLEMQYWRRASGITCKLLTVALRTADNFLFGG